MWALDSLWDSLCALHGPSKALTRLSESKMLPKKKGKQKLRKQATEKQKTWFRVERLHTTRFLPRRSGSESPAVPPLHGRGPTRVTGAPCRAWERDQVCGTAETKQELSGSRGRAGARGEGKMQEEFLSESLEGLLGEVASLPVCTWSKPHLCVPTQRAQDVC